MLKGCIKILYRQAILILSILIFFVSLILFLLYSQNNTSTTIAPKYHFFFIAQNSVDPFWNEVIKGVKQAAKDNGAAVEFYAPRFNDTKEELKYIDIAALSKVDGIITDASNMTSFTELIDKACEDNIPVVTIENDDNESKRQVFVGTNSYIIGREAGKLILQATGGKANIAVISSIDSNQGSVEQNLKMNGFISIIKNYPNMKIVRNYSSKMGTLSAEEITQSIIDSKDKINAIFTVSSADTLGAAQFIVDRNKVGDIKLVGYGNSNEISRYVDNGVIYGTVASDPYNMGMKSLKALIDIKEHKIVPNFIDTEVKIVTKRSLYPFTQ